MSGGRFEYLGQRAEWGDLFPVPHELEEMAERLAELPYATKAAADTAAVVETIRSARAQAERLARVWHIVEWWDSGDSGEDQAQEVIAAYENPADQPGPYDLPDRTHLIGKPVTVTLHPWARQGPTEGVFAGQGEKGLTLRMVGGGRWLWWHTEVACVDAAPESASGSP